MILGTLRYYEGGLTLDNLMSMETRDFEMVQVITEKWIIDHNREIERSSRGK